MRYNIYAIKQMMKQHKLLDNHCVLLQDCSVIQLPHIDDKERKATRSALASVVSLPITISIFFRSST